jgi:hypothetical protein
MYTPQEIQRMLEQFIDKRTGRAFFVRGKVTNIDKEQDTCDITPIDGGAEYQDVQLLPLTGGNGGTGFIMYPKKDTNAVAIMINDTEAFLLSVQEVESMKLFVSDSFKLEVDNQGNAVFNDGNNGGLIIIQKLKEQIDKNSQLLQTMLNVFSVQVLEPGNGAPSAFQTALLSATTGRQVADLTNVTNNKIKH